MDQDKYSAVWVSYSSITDFLNCPRLYYLNHVYKVPKTGRKLTLINPALALGQAVHEVIESISMLPVDKRFDESLISRLDESWVKIKGNRGGFTSESQERRYKSRGANMLRTLMKHPGPIKNRAVKIKKDLPNFWLSNEDNIILCGKIDWLEYLSDIDSVHIIEFKTGKGKIDVDSLQLPIYYLLTVNCQKRRVAKMSYWYIDHSQVPTEVDLPDERKAHEQVLEIAKKIKTHRQLEHFTCPQKTGCRHCTPFERIVSGEAELVGVDDFNRDVYVLPDFHADVEETSVIL